MLPPEKAIPAGKGDVRISVRNPGAKAKDLKKAIEWYLVCYCPEIEAKWPKPKSLAIPPEDIAYAGNYVEEEDFEDCGAGE